jgi:prepilin-type N-terminal cleavage/methylation domain-containing protein
MAHGETGAQAGYTLAEMMVALLVIGLTVAGLAAASAQLGRLQRTALARIARADTDQRLQQAFQSLLQSAGPFRSSDASFAGSSRDFDFPCGTQHCSAALGEVGEETVLRLRTPDVVSIGLGRLHNAHFEYVGSKTSDDTWPATTSQTERLEAVRLLSADAKGFNPLATARVWRQEEPGCQFDAVIGDCRGRGS